MKTLKCTIDQDYDIHYHLYGEERATLTYPGEEAYVDIISISYEGVELSEELFDKIMDIHGEYLEEMILDDYYESERGGDYY